MMEALDIDLQTYMYKILENDIEIISFFDTRVKIGISIGRALEMVYEHFTHCDLKPENIMLKKVNSDWQV